MITSSQGK